MISTARVWLARVWARSGRARETQLVRLAPFTLVAGVAVLLYSFLPGPPFRLEQYDLVKEVALLVLGALCAVHLLLAPRIYTKGVLDLASPAILAWGAVLTVIVAVNPDAAWRLTAIYAAACLLFLLARNVSSSSDVDWVYTAVCGLFVGLALIVIFEAWGLIGFISAPGRRPGGTLGNRNLAARVVCLGLPLLWRLLVTARRTLTLAFVGAAIALAFAAILVTRSRGVWLVAATLFVGLPIASSFLWHRATAHRVPGAASVWVVSALLGVVLVLLLPNHLGWREQDFLSSAQALLDYQSGTGRGRVIQMQTSLRMIKSAPWLGVAPGNWSVIYPAFAQAGDPSVNLNAFYPGPQVPRNDPLSFAAEYGIPAALVTLAVAYLAFRSTVATITSSDKAVQLSGLMVLAVFIAASALCLFDSIARMAVSAAVTAVLLGLGSGEGARQRRAHAEVPAWRRRYIRAFVVVLGTIAAFGAAKSMRELAAFRIVRRLSSIDELYEAVRIAPSNVEARMLLSFALVGTRRCDLVEPQLAAVARLQPYTRSVQNVRAECYRQTFGALYSPIARRNVVTPDSKTAPTR